MRRAVPVAFAGGREVSSTVLSGRGLRQLANRYPRLGKDVPPCSSAQRSTMERTSGQPAEVHRILSAGAAGIAVRHARGAASVGPGVMLVVTYPNAATASAHIADLLRSPSESQAVGGRVCHDAAAISAAPSLPLLRHAWTWRQTRLQIGCWTSTLPLCLSGGPVQATCRQLSVEGSATACCARPWRLNSKRCTPPGSHVRVRDTWHWLWHQGAPHLHS